VLCVDVRSQIQALEHTVLAKATDRCCARYHMLERGVTYTDLGDDYYLRRQAEHTDRYRQGVVRQLERMRHKVTLDPLPAAA